MQQGVSITALKTPTATKKKCRAYKLIARDLKLNWVDKTQKTRFRVEDIS